MFFRKQRKVACILSLVSLFLVCSCGKAAETSPVDSSIDSTTVSDIENSTAITTQDESSLETTMPPSPTPSIPEEIVFEMPSEQTSTHQNRLHLEATASSVYVLGGEGDNVKINGTISDIEGYMHLYTDEIGNVEYAMDGSSLAIKLDANEYGSGRLIYSDGKSYDEVATSVDSFHLSIDGSALLYLVTSQYEDGIGGKLFYYDCLTGESKQIAEDASRLFVISPNGDSISYTTFYEPGDRYAVTCYNVVIGSDPVKVGDNCYSVAISDDAGCFYFLKNVDGFEVLCVNYQGLIKELSGTLDVATYGSSEHLFFFNEDQSQIVFNSNGAMYLSMRGSDPYKVLDNVTDSFAGVSAGSGRLPTYLLKTELYSEKSYFSTYVYGTSDLCNVPFLTEDNQIVFFDENLVATVYSDIAENVAFRIHENMFLPSIETYAELMQIFPNLDVPDISFDPVCYTKDLTLFYLKNPSKQVEGQYPYPTFFDMYTANASGTETLVAADATSIALYEKDGAVTLYYLACPDDYLAQTTENKNLAPFMNLYSLSTAPDASPVLIAEKVSKIKTGDYGVIYWQFKSNDPNADDSSGDHVSSSFQAIVDVYYSKDGLSFEKITEREYTKYYGG